MATIGGTEAAAAGGTPEQMAEAAGGMTGFGLAGRPGGKSLQEWAARSAMRTGDRRADDHIDRTL